MKKTFTIAAIAAVLVLFAGCDSFKDTPLTISLGNQTFSFDIESSESMAQGSRSPLEDGYFLQGSYKIELTDAMFNELRDYLGDKIEFEVSHLKTTIVPAAGYENLEISSFKASASGISPDYTKDMVPINEEFSDSALTRFINKSIAEVISSEELTITASGKTNITSEAQIGKIDITFKLKAKVYLLK